MPERNLEITVTDAAWRDDGTVDGKDYTNDMPRPGSRFDTCQGYRTDFTSKNPHKEYAMNPLNSIKGTLIAGFVLAIVIALALNMGLGTVNWLTVVRWIHILAGLTWIGLLYYFNFVQTPGMAVAAADKGGPGGAGVSKYIAPRALLWFRWSALLTWVMGF